MGVRGEDDGLLQEYAWLDEDFCEQLQQEREEEDTAPQLQHVTTSSDGQDTGGLCGEGGLCR